MVLKRAVILKLCHMPNVLTLIMHKKLTKFSGMLGENKTVIQEKFCYKILNSDQEIKKGYSQDLVKQSGVLF